MLCTPDEAAAKWCPMAREAAAIQANHPLPQVATRMLPSGPAMNRWTVARKDENGAMVPHHRHSRCLGPECMMWRWGAPLPGEVVYTHRAACEDWQRLNPPPEDAAAQADWAERGARYAADLPRPPAPDARPGWQYGTGWDDEHGLPYSRWHRPPVPRGFCGLAGSP